MTAPALFDDHFKGDSTKEDDHLHDEVNETNAAVKCEEMKEGDVPPEQKQVEEVKEKSKRYFLVFLRGNEWT